MMKLALFINDLIIVYCHYEEHSLHKMNMQNQQISLFVACYYRLKGSTESNNKIRYIKVLPYCIKCVSSCFLFYSMMNFILKIHAKMHRK